MASDARSLIASTCASLLLAGCGTASTSDGGWIYTGHDMPPFPPTTISAEHRREMKEALGDRQVGVPSEAWQAKWRDDFERLKRTYTDARALAKTTCARETGESATPSFWTGYAPRFIACMVAHGWSPSHGGDPL